MRIEEAIGRQIALLRAERRLSLAELGEALGRYLDKPWSRQAVHQAERGRRSFTAAELAALALVLGTSVPALFRADNGPVQLPGCAVVPDEYRDILLNRETDAPLDGVEELIVALHDIGAILSRPALARLARIGRAAEEVAAPGPQGTTPEGTRAGPGLGGQAERPAASATGSVAAEGLRTSEAADRDAEAYIRVRTPPAAPPSTRQ